MQTDLTPLHMASMQGHTEVARLLLIKGAEVNKQSGGREWTARQYAVRNGKWAVDSVLFSYGGKFGKGFLNMRDLTRHSKKCQKYQYID